MISQTTTAQSLTDRQAKYEGTSDCKKLTADFAHYIHNYVSTLEHIPCEQ